MSHNRSLTFDENRILISPSVISTEVFVTGKGMRRDFRAHILFLIYECQIMLHAKFRPDLTKLNFTSHNKSWDLWRISAKMRLISLLLNYIPFSTFHDINYYSIVVESHRFMQILQENLMQFMEASLGKCYQQNFNFFLLHYAVGAEKV